MAIEAAIVVMTIEAAITAMDWTIAMDKIEASIVVIIEVSVAIMQKVFA